MLSAQEVKDYIQQGLDCDYVAVRGDDGQHFEAIVVSALFAGKRPVQQHQMVYQALGDRMQSEIHALSMRTFTPDAWAQSSQELIEEH